MLGCHVVQEEVSWKALVSKVLENKLNTEHGYWVETAK